MPQLKEQQFLQSIFRSVAESARQNQPFEADVEIIDLPFSPDHQLAVTVDIIAEEIEYGLYTDPFLIGWMSVIISLSDLAAAGADPIGLLSILNVQKALPESFLVEAYRGIEAAAKTFSVAVLGGDTNFTQETQIGSVAIGTVATHHYLSRKGIQEGDHLFSTGPLGSGNGLAFVKLLGNGENFPYRPVPKLAASRVFRKYATASIDTSDGFFPALCQLLALNAIGFYISSPWEKILAEEINTLNEVSGVPPWFFLAGPHGEFEVLFSIPETQIGDFLSEARDIHWQPLLIGKATAEKGTTRHFERIIPAFAIANAFFESSGDPEVYFNQLLNLQKEYKL